MATTIDKIYKWVDYKGDSIYKLSKEIGVSNGYFSKQKQSNGAISSNIIEKIVSYYEDLDANWLLNNSDSMLKDEKEKTILDDNDNCIPLIDDYRKIIKEVKPKNHRLECFRVPFFEDADYLITIHGDSMIPEYNSGDIVGCKKLERKTFLQWNKVYVFYTEQGVLIKRVFKGSDENHILLSSDNKSYESFEINYDDIISFAIVVGVIRIA